MNTYPKYKDSGEQWLGQIPEHWEVKRLMSCFSQRTDRYRKGETLDILSLLKDVGIVPYEEKGNKGNTAKTDVTQYKVARKGDLVINSMNVIIGSLGITPMDGYISPAYYAFSPRENICTRYYNYILLLRRAQQNIRRYAKGIMEIRLKISANDFLSIQYPVPPLVEQEAIVAYLDKQTCDIDKAIQREQAMIDLLEERKQIIIQNAVTKGLNNDAPMKDSGIDWIGEIPEGWKVRRFKYLFQTCTGITFTKADLVEEGFPVLSYGQVHSKQNKSGTLNESLIKYIPFSLTKGKDQCLTYKGDFIFADTSEDFEGCGNNIYVDTDYPVYAGYHTIIAKRNNEECGKYLGYLFASRPWRGQIRTLVNGVKVYSITQGILRSSSVLLPPLDEQEKIAAFLDRKVGSIDKAIASKNRVIALLQERKQIIISEVVTGKIKIS